VDSAMAWLSIWKRRVAAENDVPGDSEPPGFFRGTGRDLPGVVDPRP
jgi:hypothetical protein